MAFQSFRLGDLSIHPAHAPHIPDTGPSHTTFNTNPHKSIASSSKQPYGSGDTDDGYTLSFPNLEAFQAWRQQEEETNMVEFVKGDTHGSKAVPPRFKDHTKLVCARHSRSGRKKYVKKHPERVRKVPSRKLEGQGCPASISYKTYFDTEEVRACYISQHSHEIGLANLPFTRRGRKAAAQEKDKRRKSTPLPTAPPPPPNTTSSSSIANAVPPITSIPSSTSVQPQDTSSSHQMNSPAPMPAVVHQQQTQVMNQGQQMQSYSSAVAMLAPLPAPQYAPAPQSYGGYQMQPQYAPPATTLSHANERWDNMATLFNTIRDHARSFEYPSASVAALETVLIRLYLESPMAAAGGSQINLGNMIQQIAVVTRQNQAGQGMVPGHGDGNP